MSELVSAVVADLVVVGAGPAGLAAATSACRAGLQVTLVDAAGQPGGQYWRHLDESAEPADQPSGDGKTYARLRAELDAYAGSGRLRYLPGRVVWFLEPATTAEDRHVLRLSRSHGAPGDGETISGRAVVLCPGSADRQLPIPGWDLPGVLAAGGAQALLKGHHTRAGARAVVAGTGPFLLPVATALAAAGVEVVEVCEAAAPAAWLPHLPAVAGLPGKIAEGVAYAATLLRHRVPYRTRQVITAIHGTDAVEAVTIARLDRTGRLRPGSERRLAVDLVALGWGFTPSLELIVAAGAETTVDVDGSLIARVDDRTRSSRPGIYVAGEASGVGGARLAVLEGELAAITVATDLGVGRSEELRRVRALQRAIGRQRKFAHALHQAHPLPRHWPDWLTPETLVCRCEEVTVADVAYARDVLGARDFRTVKLLARPGMGWCQGRICGYATACLANGGRRPPDVSELTPVAHRPLCGPVTLGDLAELTNPS